MSENENIENKDLIKDIVQVIKSIRFGYIQIIVQDSKVVQIDKTEKIRLNGARFREGVKK